MHQPSTKKAVNLCGFTAFSSEADGTRTRNPRIDSPLDAYTSLHSPTLSTPKNPAIAAVCSVELQNPEKHRINVLYFLVGMG
mgnify:FL=1